MKRKIPAFKSDRAAAAFVDKADLTEYDLSGATLTRFEIKPKDKSVNLRLSKPALRRCTQTGRTRWCSLSAFHSLDAGTGHRRTEINARPGCRYPYSAARAGSAALAESTLSASPPADSWYRNGAGGKGAAFCETQTSDNDVCATRQRSPTTKKPLLLLFLRI